MRSDLTAAILAGVLWAVSAQVVSVGLDAVRTQTHGRLSTLLFGLYLAMVVGFLVVWAATGFINPLTTIDFAIALGGLLTFPVGTGLYYVCSAAYGDRASLASQFSNVKPLLSIALAVLVFREAGRASDPVVVGLISVGVLVLVSSAIRKGNSVLPAVLGLLLAISWSGGEAFVKWASGGTATPEITVGTLFVSLIATTPVVAVVFARSTTEQRRQWRSLAPVLTPFAVHGLLSFGIAYFFFFASIGEIGLGRTVMVTVAWPALALALDLAIRLVQRKPFDLSLGTVCGLVLFSVAAIVHAIG